MGKKEFIEAWNKAFFTENGELNGATLDIEVALSFPGGTVQFAVQGITPKTRINEIARTYADSLPDVAASSSQPVHETSKEAQEAPMEAKPGDSREEEEKTQNPVKEVVANEHIAYRQNSYLVQHYRLDGVDHYNVFNEGTGKAISPASVTGRSVLKKYREEEVSEVEAPSA